MELEKKDYAAELEQYLKERRGTFLPGDLIRDIRVSPEGEKLKVELLSCSRSGPLCLRKRLRKRDL